MRICCTREKSDADCIGLDTFFLCLSNILRICPLKQIIAVVLFQLTVIGMAHPDWFSCEDAMAIKHRAMSQKVLLNSDQLVREFYQEETEPIKYKSTKIHLLITD